MQKPLLDLKRLWRVTHTGPDANLHGVAAIFCDRDDPASLSPYGYHTIEDLSQHECLFLLGRPGAGKSAELLRLAGGKVAGFRDEWIVLIPCKGLGVDLYSEIDREPRWCKAFEESQLKPARLVLDGLDEGFLRDPAFFGRLKRTLEILRSEHPELRLMLTCRPGERDEAFENDVHAAWRGTGNPAVFALEPLSQKNQHTLAQHRGVEDIAGFVQWIQHNNFEEFAAWPRSLEWLSAEFQHGNRGKLKYTELCQRRVSRSFGEDKRLVEAGRADRAEEWTQAIMLVAATLVFCGHKGVALDSAKADCLALDEMFSMVERPEMPGRRPLTRETVREAVRASHLMEAHGGYHRFQNQSDLEFLAAAMLVSLKVEQLKELFGCPDDSGRWCVFPQLATTAANLAAQSPEFFKYLLENDPRVLMRVDFASKSEDARRDALNAIFVATDTANATSEHEQHSHFTTLCHPKIEAQLESWLFEKKHSFIVRSLAFSIAEACCKKDFWEKFWHVASTHGDAFIESRLPEVVMSFGRDWPEERLKELSASPHNDLSGAAMGALLDRGWKPRNLVPFLREPSENTVDAYSLLLMKLRDQCDSDDIMPLLDWVGGLPGGGSEVGVRELVQALVRKSIPLLDRRDVWFSLTGFLIARLQRYEYDPILQGTTPAQLEPLGLDTPENRRKLLRALADAWPQEMGKGMSDLNFPILHEDYGWLLDEVAIAKGNGAKFLAKLACSHVWQFYEDFPEQLERAYNASAELRAQLPVADAEGICATLIRLRAEGDERHRIYMAEFETKQKRPIFNHEQHLNQAIKTFRAGNMGAWIDICFALSHPKSGSDSGQFLGETNIRQLAGWNAASDELRAELTRFGRDFLLKAEIPLPGPNQIPQEFFGIVYALSLHAHRLTEDVELRAGIRPIWALAVLRHCGSEDGPLVEPLSLLTSVAPGAVAEACRIEFRQRWERNENIFGQLFPFAFSPEMEEVLVRVLETAPLQPEAYMSGLVLLEKHNSHATARLAEERLREYEKEADGPARRAALAACLFIVTSLWKKAWPLVISESAVAHQLLLEYSTWVRYHQQEDRLNAMPTSLMVALFALSLKCFSPKDMPSLENGRTLDSFDDAYDLQRNLQRKLESLGAHSELNAIYKRNMELRQAWWTGPSVDRAKSVAHAGRWTPPNAVEFVRFLATEGGTFVRDNDSLQRAVMASLRRFEQALHPNHIHRLWEKQHPRSEEAFQVEIADHLKSDLRNLVVNMETKVERRERADIRVEAVGDSIAVTLEVKLGHSADRERPIRTAMRSQLRAYLEKQNETHGIYVVGWFFCGAFRPSALRDLKSLRSAQKYFDAQAKKLSTDGYVLAASVIDCRWLASISTSA